ncbi:MAG: addiction module protein [bacterium]
MAIHILPLRGNNAQAIKKSALKGDNLMEVKRYMNTIEAKKMSVIERLRTMETLWDSLIAEETEMESPEWHTNVLNERREMIKNGETEFISLEKLKASRNEG